MNQWSSFPLVFSALFISVESVVSTCVGSIFNFSMANPRLRILLRWRNWSKKDWAIAAVGFAVVVFTLSLVSDSRRGVVVSQVKPSLGLSYPDDLVDLTLVRSAKDRGACMCETNLILFSHHQRLRVNCTISLLIEQFELS